MRIVDIPKGNGKMRRIYVPDPVEKAMLRAMLPRLNELQERHAYSAVVHAFVRGRSPLTNAKQHRGFQYTLKFDLKDFFDTVTRDKLESKDGARFPSPFEFKDLDLCFPDGAARQGLPTSPIIANIAAFPMDGQLLALKGRTGRFEVDFVYTRYADDLTFSFDDARIATVLKLEVPVIVERCGFVLNESKTRLQCAKVGRRKITGYAVDDEVYPTRELRRRLRAAKHQGRPSQIAGLEEWCRMRLPRNYTAPIKAVVQALRAVSTPRARQIANAPRENTVSSVVHNAVSVMKRAFDFSEPKAWYFSFGQAHIHFINDVKYDKDCIVKIYATNEHEAQDRMMRAFGEQWSMRYDEKTLDMSFFPRGIIELKGW